MGADLQQQRDENGGREEEEIDCSEEGKIHAIIRKYYIFPEDINPL